MGDNIHEIPSSSCFTCQMIIPRNDSLVPVWGSINGGIHINSISPSPYQPSSKNISLAISMYGSALLKQSAGRNVKFRLSIHS